MILEGIHTQDGFLYDLQTKLTGIFTIKVSGCEPDALRCMYGPYRDFIRFAMKLRAARGDGYTLYTHDNVVSCRYILVCGAERGAAGITVCFEPEMREVRQQGLFQSGSPLMNDICAVSAHTLHLCLVKHFRGNSTCELQLSENQAFAHIWHGRRTDYVIMDGPRRDREVWVGDLLPEMRTVLALFDDREAVRNSLEVILARQDEAGHIPGSSISACRFYEYEAWFVIIFYEYYMLSGDARYVESRLPRIISILNFLVSRLDENGLISFPKANTWAWTLSRSGYLTSSHCVLQRAFSCAAALMRLVEQPGAERFEKIAGALREKINRLGYDPDAGCYLDVLGEQEKRYSLDAACFALLFEVAAPETVSVVLARIKRFFWCDYGSLLVYPKEPADGQNWVHNDHIWPFVVGFEVEARLKYGDFEGAYALLERTWGTMLKHGAQTFWEIIDGRDGSFMKERIIQADDDRDTWNSACHGWSAGLPPLFIRYIAGLAPASPGYGEFTLNPNLYRLQTCEARVMSVNGLITAVLRRTRDGLEADLTIPEGCKGRTSLPLYRGGTLIPDGRIAESGRYLFYESLTRREETR